MLNPFEFQVTEWIFIRTYTLALDLWTCACSREADPYSSFARYYYTTGSLKKSRTRHESNLRPLALYILHDDAPCPARDFNANAALKKQHIITPPGYI